MMVRVLIAVDGSQPSLRAVQHALGIATSKSHIDLHLVNVQVPLPAAAADFLNPKDIRRFHMDEGNAALHEARKIVDSAHVRYESTVLVGPYAEERQCDQIIMGTRGLSPVAGLLLGSVAMKMLHLAQVPLSFIK
jgi:nucleotide-binding universal stress UspA family protein